MTEVLAGGAGGRGPAVLVPGFVFNNVCPVWYFPNPAVALGHAGQVPIRLGL